MTINPRSQKRGSIRSAVIMAACVFTTMGAPGLVDAGDWKVTDDIGLTSTYVDRTGANAQSGLVLELKPRWMVKGRGGRVTADVNYAPSLAHGFGDTDPKTLTHDLLATSRLEAVRDKFFIGAEAAARLTGGDSTSGTVDNINFNNDNGQQSYSLRVLPEFRHHLNRYADIVSKNSVDYVTYSDSDSGDSNSVNGNLSLRSGRYFGRTDWSVDTNYRETSYDDRNDTRKDISGTLGYRIDRRWRVFGSLGYEDNDVDTGRDDTTGATWDVGADWTPNPRTSVSAKYGSRYFDESWSGSVSHRSKRTRLGLDFSRSVENRRNQQLVDSFFFFVDDDGNIVTDPVTGAPIIANIPQLNETDEDYLNTQVRGILTVTGRRTTASFTGTVSQRDYEVSENGEDSYDFSARLSRQLGSGYNGSLTATLRHTERDSGTDSDSYEAAVSLSKTFSRRTSASIDYSYRDENDDSPDSDYTEHRIGLTLRANLL